VRTLILHSFFVFFYCGIVANVIAQNNYGRNISQRATMDSINLQVVDSTIVQEESTEISDIHRLTPQERLMRAKQLERKTSNKDNYYCTHHPAMQSESVGVCILCGNVLKLHYKQTIMNRNDSTKVLPKKNRLK